MSAICLAAEAFLPPNLGQHMADHHQNLLTGVHIYKTGSEIWRASKFWPSLWLDHKYLF